jgi:glycosyltransferase involved in cell wall biosynthesis
MKIAVITPVYALAGVPLAQIRFARALSSRGHNVNLIIGHVPSEYNFEPPENIKTTILEQKKVRGCFWPLLRYLWIEKPEVVFSAEDHLNITVLIAALLVGFKGKISGSSRVTPFDTYSNKPLTKGWVLKQLAKLVMARADALTCVSMDMVLQYQKVFDAPPHVCVYNIVDDSSSRNRLTEEVDHRWFFLGSKSPLLVAAGRLAPWKGFDDLIEAMALLTVRCDARLLILGDGPQRQSLQNLIDERGLRDKVELVGYVENPLKFFRQADVFILSSLVEGLPNVLVEAMMCGCTPVATDCPTGPREVLSNGMYGYLVPVSDSNTLAGAIIKALESPIPKYLLDQAVIPFHEKNVIDRHFEILGIKG